MMKTDNGEPPLIMWVGNFFEPERSSKDAMRRALENLRRLGFNTVCLDSKQSEDFRARFTGEPVGDYVAMQEFAMRSAAELGLHHMFLALYCCGDNLYPVGLRQSPPIYGEEAVGLDGKGMQTYKYWSPRAQSSMIEHCRGLLENYSEGHSLLVGECGRQLYPMISMFDPCLRPSFDDEGRTRYMRWLERKYGGIETVNARYCSSFSSISELQPGDYWFKPETINWWAQEGPSDDDLAHETPALMKWIDNQLWRVEETVGYFAGMRRRFDDAGLPLYLMPCLQQWKLFLNDYGLETSTSFRALDPWRIAPHVHSATFQTLPADCHSRANAYVISLETSIARSANEGRDFVMGLDILRYVTANVYAQVSPAEAIATAAANGATGLSVYGYNGLDDGGAFSVMPELFKESVKTGLDWFKRAVPRLESPRDRQIALLFPLAMSVLEPSEPGTARADHRLDLLGWHQLLCDIGYPVDVVHPCQVANGALGGYVALVIPTDTCYRHMRDEKLEAAVAEWVGGGGVVLHGPDCGVVGRISPVPHPLDGIEYVRWEPCIVPEGFNLCSFDAPDAVAQYESGSTAVAATPMGRGAIYSFGFDPGYAYVKRRPSGVPGKYAGAEMYALPLLEPARGPVAAVLRKHCEPAWTGVRGVEYARFGEAVVVVNHNAYPCRLPGWLDAGALYMYEAGCHALMPHSAALCLTKEKPL